MNRTRRYLLAAAIATGALTPLVLTGPLQAAPAHHAPPAPVHADPNKEGICVGMTAWPYVGACVPAQVVPPPSGNGQG